MLKYNIRSAGYVEDKPVLRDINGLLDDGESVIVAGPSGSGKTTLLLAITGVLNNLLNGWVDGSVLINNVNPLDIDEFAGIPRMIGVVLQDPDKQIAMPTPFDEASFILENLGFSEEEVRDRTLKYLRRYGLGEKAFKHVEYLSGGEKRRLTFVAAVIHEPETLLLDEPTASMDPWGIREIRSFIIESRRSGREILVVEHKLRYFLDLVDRVIILRGGRIHGVFEPGNISSRELRLFEELGIDARQPRIKPPRRLGSDYKLLETRDLSIGYSGGEEPLLEDINICVYRGEIVAVIGPNGSGKTTLLKTLLGALKPISGEILFMGERLTYRRGRLYKGVFYVPQHPDYLFIESSLESEVREVSRKTGMDYSLIIDHIPWFNELRDQSPYSLSHGQRRWLSIIIGWSYKPEILLLDEPTTGLDYSLFSRLGGLVSELSSRGLSFIIATHDPRVVGEWADRVYMIDRVRRRVLEIDKYRAVKYLEENAGVRYE